MVARPSLEPHQPRLPLKLVDLRLRPYRWELAHLLLGPQAGLPELLDPVR